MSCEEENFTSGKYYGDCADGEYVHLNAAVCVLTCRRALNFPTEIFNTKEIQTSLAEKS